MALSALSLSPCRPRSLYAEAGDFTQFEFHVVLRTYSCLNGAQAVIRDPQRDILVGSLLYRRLGQTRVLLNYSDSVLYLTTLLTQIMIEFRNSSID